MAFIPIALNGVCCTFSRSKRLLRDAVCLDSLIPKSRFSYDRRVTIVSDASKQDENLFSHSASRPDSNDHNSSISMDENETRSKFDSITNEGEQMLDNVADDVRNDMNQLSDSLEEFAEKVIQEETDALLEKYESRQNELLEKVREERRFIEQEMNRFGALSASTERPKAASTLAERILLVATFLFGLAAVAYTWTAVVSSDSTALRNAVIDMAVAVCAAYALSSRKK